MRTVKSKIGLHQLTDENICLFVIIYIPQTSWAVYAKPEDSNWSAQTRRLIYLSCLQMSNMLTGDKMKDIKLAEALVDCVPAGLGRVWGLPLWTIYVHYKLKQYI